MNFSYKVFIRYRPEKLGAGMEEEALAFTTEESARAFAERQNKLPSVDIARYIGQ